MEKTGIREILRNNPQIIDELGNNLYSMLERISPRQGEERLTLITPENCVEFMRDQTISYQHFGHKSVIDDNLANHFPDIPFEQIDPESDYVSDIDFLGWVGEKAFGIQIKPVTAKANFGNYSPSERMRHSFNDFTKEYGGNVFLVYSIDDTIQNEEVVGQIAEEIRRLQKQK